MFFPTINIEMGVFCSVTLKESLAPPKKAELLFASTVEEVDSLLRGMSSADISRLTFVKSNRSPGVFELGKEGRVVTPLGEACRRGDIKVAKRMISVGMTCHGIVSYHSWEGLFRQTYVQRRDEGLIHELVRKKDVKMLTLILPHLQAKYLHEEMEEKMTPLMVACAKGHFDIVKLLLPPQPLTIREPREVWRKCPGYRDALYWAIVGGNLAIVEYLVTHHRCVIRYYSLKLVLQRNRVDILEILLRGGLCPEAYCSQNSKETLLFYAARHKNVAMTKLLLAHGANPFTLNRAGYLPWDYANQEIQDLLTAN